jgi:hypothetical protein
MLVYEMFCCGILAMEQWTVEILLSDVLDEVEKIYVKQ